jgi:hypothetical protein
MNGRAWVVEVKDMENGGKWEPLSVKRSRRAARVVAAMFRGMKHPTRVRQYIRQPEVRP